jgi:hypothetical protein
MPLDLEIMDKEGNTHASDVNTIMGQLQNAGYNPKATTPDGLNIIMTDDQGDYTMPIDQVLQNVGVKLAGMKPQQADESGINALWRYGVESLPQDDDVRKAFITSKLQKEAGVQNPQVTGKGSDWYYFNPSERKWMALTSGEGMTSATLAGMAPGALKMVGSATGGMLGTLAGGGLLSAATGAGGAIAGGRAGDAANSLIAGQIDPEIEELSSKYAEQKHGKGLMNRALGNLSENKVDMALDGVTGGLAGLVPKLFAKGAASQAARATGKVSNTAGDITQGGVNIVDNPIGRALIRSPVTGAVEGGAFLAQAPGYAITKGTELLNRGANWLAKKGSKVGQSVAGFTDDLLRARGPSDEIVHAAEKAGESMGKATSKKMLIGAEEAAPKRTARDIMGNLAEKFGAKRNPKNFLESGKFYTQEEAEQAAREAVAKNSMGAGKFGEMAGSSVDAVTNAGRAIEDGLDYATKKGLGGIRNVGKAASATGRGMQTVGALTNPWENRLLARQGLDRGFKKQGDYTPEELKAFFKKTNAQKLYGAR